MSQRELSVLQRGLMGACIDAEEANENFFDEEK